MKIWKEFCWSKCSISKYLANDDIWWSLDCFQEGQIDALFQKIDWSSEGSITWDEFCTYMQLEYAEKEDSYLRAREVGN